MNPLPSICRAPLALVLAALLAACGPDDSSDEAGGTDGAGGDDGSGDGTSGDDGGEPPAPPSADIQCSDASECVAVASTCCECPTFAVRVGSGFDEGCSRVECEDEPTGCAAVEPACVESTCQLVCRRVNTTRTCALGFARDSLGCLLDACNMDPPDELVACAGDGDCSQVKADCCGCTLGGEDRAVASSQVQDFLDSLACGPDPRCPDVNVCDAALVPRCIAQSCTLATEDDGATDDGGTDGGDGDGGGDGDTPGSEGDLCGVPGFTCDVGLVCVLNHPDGGGAGDIGVGTCRAGA